MATRAETAKCDQRRDGTGQYTERLKRRLPVHQGRANGGAGWRAGGECKTAKGKTTRQKHVCARRPLSSHSRHLSLPLRRSLPQHPRPLQPLHRTSCSNPPPLHQIQSLYRRACLVIEGMVTSLGDHHPEPSPEMERGDS